MSEQLISISIDQIGRTDFEIWVQKVLSLTDDYNFEPTGGIHDGGQDGFVRPLIGDTEHYIQISKQQDTRSKVRETISAIRKSRQIKRLTYITSQQEPERDLTEAKLSKYFDVKVIIHDQRWLVIQSMLYEQLQKSLFGFVREFVDGLKKATSVKRELNFSDRLSIVTYLEAQAKSLPASESFQNLCLDTLIYEFLIGTNPEIGEFKTKEQIDEFLTKNNKNVLAKATMTLHQRLEWLCSKENLPRIRKHPGSKFALPYEVRNEFDEKNLALKALEDTFLGSINRRVEQELGEKNRNFSKFIVAAVAGSIKETFQRQALNFVSSFSSTDFDPHIEVFTLIDKALSEFELESEHLEICTSACTNVFRRVCYSSNPEERKYLELLMKYFSMKFIMDGDVAVTRYFSEMAKQLRIYLGTDIIVRCLSETFALPTSRGMTNTLKKFQNSGVKLRITRQVAAEVFSHLHRTYLTFRNEYEDWYRHGSLEAVKHCDLILIRAFFYAYFEPDGHLRKPKDWSDYLNQLGRAVWFRDPDKNIDNFTSFLIDKFNFEFVELEDLRSKIDEDLAKRVADEILEQREVTEQVSGQGYQILAQNDAEMSLFVNAERRERSERVTSDLYGYNTWWMTEKTKVLRALENNGQPADVVMQPQFLINQYLLDTARNRIGSDDNNPITPTLFGLRITDRIPPNEMEKFLHAVGDLAQLDESASRAHIRESINKLKQGAYR